MADNDGRSVEHAATRSPQVEATGYAIDPGDTADRAGTCAHRASAQCVEKLGQVWTSAAETAERSTLTEERDERGDGRSASGRAHDSHQSSVRVRMRTSVLTLVVVAPRPETSERALAAINALHQRHPSRAIVVSPGDFDGPATMDAHIYAECTLSDRSGAEMCTEQILIKTGGELSQHLSRVVTPLLIHDLPVVLWWPDDPPFGSRQFTEVVGTSDRLLVDSGHVPRGRRHAAGRTGHRGRGWRRRHGHRLAAADAVARAARRAVRPPAADARAGPHPQRAHRRRTPHVNAAHLQGRLLPRLARVAPGLGGQAATDAPSRTTTT